MCIVFVIYVYIYKSDRLISFHIQKDFMKITKLGNLVNGGANTEAQLFSLLLSSLSNTSHCVSRLRLANIPLTCQLSGFHYNYKDL